MYVGREDEEGYHAMPLEDPMVNLVIDQGLKKVSPSFKHKQASVINNIKKFSSQGILLKNKQEHSLNEYILSCMVTSCQFST